MSQLSLLQQIAPDSYQIVMKRADLLKWIQENQPIGRRTLAKKMNISERMIRSETDYLKEIGLLKYDAKGMTLTNNGQSVCTEFQNWIKRSVLTMNQKEKQVASVLHIPFCKIVPSDQHVGECVEDILCEWVPSGNITIAVTGGQTMATVATLFSKKLAQKRLLTFVPARGGVGGGMVLQANSISEQLAERTGGKHYPLYIPEHISKETYVPLTQEPSIAKAISLMKHADVLLYSIGNAKIMEDRRGLTTEEKNKVEQQKAIGEAFGCFFNAAGEVVHKLPRVGVHLSDLPHIPYTVAVVTGSGKALALKAYAKMSSHSNTWFVLDEDVVNMVLSGETH